MKNFNDSGGGGCASLTVKAAAARLGISTKLLYALVASGRIPHYRYGLGRGTIRIREEALTAFEDRCKVSGQRALQPLVLRHLNLTEAGS